MKRFIFVLAFMAGCSRPIDTSGNKSVPNTSTEYVGWKKVRIGDNPSTFVITDPANGQEYIYIYGGGITPRLK